LIGIDCETFDFWKYIEVSLLSPKALSQYVERLPFDYLTLEMWGKLVSHFHGVSLDDLRVRRFRGWDRLTGNSKILSKIPAPLKQFEDKKWKLLYRGSRDGFRASHFHRLCDGCANTVTLILTATGCIFGGFTSVPWDSTNRQRPDGKPTSFLFTVKDARGSPPSTFPFPPNSPNAGRAYEPIRSPIQCHGSCGPTFGPQDLYVADNCDINSSSCSGNGLYRNTEGVFTGERSFLVKEIEVLSISL
jgi:hypothetical protein